MAIQSRPLLIVISAPSGAGKSTLCGMLLQEFPDIRYSISCTTRAPRGQEEHGRHYFFLTPEDFECRVRNGEFLEHAVVHGYRYGTLRSHVMEQIRSGQGVLLDIDVQGARQIRGQLKHLPRGDVLRESFVDIFIAPPSMNELRRRLEKRGEDSPEVVEQRLENAAMEMACRDEYTYRMVNNKLDEAYEELKGIILRERQP
jgi:guanylate kinase